MEELVRLLKENKLTIGSCESLTAGLFTSMIARVSGASAVLRGGKERCRSCRYKDH